MVAPGGAPRQLLGREERQASILRGAAQAFARAGFAGTSMDDVAAAAGITKLIVYRHFDSKDELYRAVLQRVSSRLAEELIAALEQPQPRAIGARVLLTVAREDPDGFVLLWRHAAREPQFAAYAAEFRAGAAEAARNLLSTGFVDPLLERWAAEAVVNFLVESVLAWLEAGDPARDDEMVDLCTHAVRAMREAWLVH